MSFEDHNGLIFIGENINATRKFLCRSKRIVRCEDRSGGAAAGCILRKCCRICLWWWRCGLFK